MPENEFTDLIDVSDVAQVLDNEDDLLPDLEETPPPTPGEFAMALLSERIAAFLIDLSLIYLLYLISIVTYCYTYIEVPPFNIPLLSKSGLILHGVVLGIAFLYFWLSEMFFSATIGKAMCRLEIRKSDGRPLTTLGSFIRNILRPIDLLIFPITLFLMERNTWHQRLGELIGKTVVIKYLSSRRRVYSPSSDNLAKTSIRTLAFLFDLLLILSFVAGMIFLLSNNSPLMSLMIAGLIPLFVFYGIAASETLFGTSPGKWLFGFVICKEDGFQARWTESILRTIYRIYDANPIGFFSAYVSSRRQRPGDSSASTVVIKQRRELKGMLCFAIGVGISLLIGYAGLENPESFMREGEKANFFVHYNLSIKQIKEHIPKRLTVSDLQYAVGTSSAIKKKPYFDPGSRIFISFLVDGYQLKSDEPWLTQDLTIKYPDGSSAIQLENLVEFRSTLTTPGPIRMENNFELPINAPSGRYTMVLTVHDKQNDKTLKRHYFFYVTKP